MRKFYSLFISVICIVGIVACSGQGGDSKANEKSNNIIKEAFGGDMFKAAQDGDLEIIKEGIAAGVNIDKTDAYGQTILMVAAEFCHFDIVKYLLKKGADKTLQNIYEQTAESNAGSSEIADYIKTYGEFEE
jgi:hypothetical protein